MLPRGQDVEDVMQEVGLVCWRKFDSFQESPSAADFIRWACVIARYEVLRHRRRAARDRLVLSEDVLELLAHDAEARLDRAEAERRAVEQCLQKLQPIERQLLLSVYTPGVTVAQIAAEVGQKARRLYSRLNALRDLVADCVRKRLSLEGHGSG